MPPIPRVRPTVRNFPDVALPCPSCGTQPVTFSIDAPTLTWFGVPLRKLARTYSLKCPRCKALTFIDTDTGNEIVARLQLD